jgi:cytochrome c oxidase subunit 4
MAGHSYSHARKLNTTVLGALIALTVITVYAAGVNFGSPSTNTVVALLIASVKATLVALFFMHLKYEKPINAIIFIIGILTLALFLIFILLDVDTRIPLRPANLAPPRGGPGTSSLVSADAEAPPAEVTPEAAGH